MNRPGIVLGSIKRLIKGQPLPFSAADHAHAIAVDGAELKSLGAEFAPVDGITVKGIRIPFETYAGGAGITHRFDHSGESLGIFKHRVGTEDENEIGLKVADAKVQHLGVLVAVRPFDNVSTHSFDQSSRSILASRIDAEDEVGVQCLALKCCEHVRECVRGIREANENTNRGSTMPSRILIGATGREELHFRRYCWARVVRGMHN